MIAEQALQLLSRTEAGRRPVRLLGVSVQNLELLDRGPRTAGAACRLPFGDEGIAMGAPADGARTFDEIDPATP